MLRRTAKKLFWTATGSACAFTLGKTLLAASKRAWLEGKVVLITGGSRGLGLVLAREFAQRGCRVAVCARNEEELSRVREEFSYLGDRFAAFRCDLGDRTQVVEMLVLAETQLGQIDILVNNAGTIQIGPIENQEVSDFEEAMRSIFWPAVYTTLAVLPRMKQRRSGQIVNITSIGGKIAVPHLLPYTAAKFALVGLSRGLRAELKKDGISVTTVVPGLMRTGSARNAYIKGQHEKEYTWFMLSASAPMLSMNAKRAARRIVQACIYKRGEVTLGVTAKIALKMEALAPGLVMALLAATNRWFLPASSSSDEKKKGAEAETNFTRSILTSLTRRAEMDNNQLSAT